MLLSQIWHCVTGYVATLGLRQEPLNLTDYSRRLNITFSADWQLLGPFQIGTREAVWGADPLEYYGGFRSLEYSDHDIFKSSLAFNGTVPWSTLRARLDNPPVNPALDTRWWTTSSAELNVGFPNIDWHALQAVYGWAALQWQGWARGELLVGDNVGSVTVVLSVEHVLELWLDGVHYFGGDFFSYGKAAVTLHLKPGTHRIDVRVLREVRADGGGHPPRATTKLGIQTQAGVVKAVTHGDLLHSAVISDISYDNSGFFASDYASISLRNDAPHTAYIHKLYGRTTQCVTEPLSTLPLKLLPGQTRPVAFRMGCVPDRPMVPLEINYEYTIEGSTRIEKGFVRTRPPLKDIHAPHKITYMHPAGMVSYAILRPPSPNAKCPHGTNGTAPVLLALHGAGLEADSELVRHALDEVSDLCAWLLFPTGVTPWSGDDWHIWGWADVEAAIAAIPAWIERHEWTGPGVNVNHWLVMGHSNGGQGTWYALTHRPDNVIAAAPLSGYSNIQNYVPYTMWRVSDPAKSALVHASLNSYRHELMLENAKGIPIFQQHGSEDDNVPPYHSRLLSQLIEQAEAESTYFEMSGRPHWWDGVMTTDPLKHFFHRHLDGNTSATAGAPPSASSFSIVSAGYGDMGPKLGFEPPQPRVPGRLAKVDVAIDPLRQECRIYTFNVRSLRLPPWLDFCRCISVDDFWMTVDAPSNGAGWTLEAQGHRWQLMDPSSAVIPKRRGSQLGAMDAILRTNGAFQIVYTSQNALHIALQVSRNLYQYYGADTIITDSYTEACEQASGNVITVAIGGGLPQELGCFDSIVIENDRIRVADHTIGGVYRFRNALGAIFLRPLPDERLELVVWGMDEEGLDIAARLVPLWTGSGQPDFVVGDRSMLWKGIDGALAMGFFDHDWKVSTNSFVS
ncbi:hypothetical protein BAUCODRAFT_33501 [Baudoinia panamericana UAMH 10762]|uniref:Peptidase S9 prolyl oligopeptidase catalytic domain-containing protein n=1 Tax=Baudoinia panamericana (strain UAMH 10762) TaxID=717646 RepID=M2NAJ7_BAUPA|nr:uncharacterized protein BAUCODRAFT_33501 [Baudoinia panamericana UAMH 10762]EMC96159.1 hypothetical protein BAUCODRAFT_33501 [Baudoinia panamericana UAMH 10762]